MRLAAVTPADVRQWYARTIAKGLRNATARQYLALVRRVFAQAIEDGLVTQNPARITVARGRDPQGWSYLTLDEQRRLLACEAIPEGDRACIAFAIYTGLRAGELCALRAADVVLGEAPHVVVRYGGPPSEPTKTGRVRVVPLLPGAVVAWRAWQPHRPKSVAAWPAPRGGFRPPDSPLGMGTNPPSSNGRWREALRAAGITRRVRWHDLRHTCGTSLLHGWWGERLALDEVRDWLGHTSVVMTERYAHAVPEGVFAAAAKVTRGSRDRTESVGIAGILAAPRLSLASSSTDHGTAVVSDGYVDSWGDRGATALEALRDGDAGPAVALLSEAIDARRAGDALEQAWSRWLRTGAVAALVDGIGLMLEARRRRHEGLEPTSRTSRT